MTDDPASTPSSVPFRRVVLELVPGAVPTGLVRSDTGDRSVSGWMELLAAIEGALAGTP
jgi:hypothetical protein